MATYPPVTSAELDAALARIEHHHRDDPRWSEAGTEPRDVLAYLRRRHTALPQFAAADVWDELVLSAWLHWEERRRERELLHRALRYGLSLTADKIAPQEPARGRAIWPRRRASCPPHR